MRKQWKQMLVVYILAMLGVLMVAVAGTQAITAISRGNVVYDRSVIIIDPGHGGIDGGATSCTGVLESKLNLEIALRLRDLSHLLGYETVMIRTTDISIHTKGESIAQKKVSDLKERVRIINTTHKGILVSIHQNHFPDGKYSGAQVFHNGSQESTALAKRMQDVIGKSINPGSKRPVKQAKGIYLMEHIETTGVLVECGFLSNYSEEAKLRNSTYQKQLCCVIMGSLSQYLNS